MLPPAGAGYALENRLAMTRSADALLAENHVRRLADFFNGDVVEGLEDEVA